MKIDWAQEFLFATMPVIVDFDLMLLEVLRGYQEKNSYFIFQESDLT